MGRCADMVAKVPKPIAALEFILFGATGIVYKLNKDIVIKCMYDQREYFEEEQEFFRVLAQVKSNPHRSAIVQCFHLCEDLTFLEYLPGKPLDRYYGSKASPLRITLSGEPDSIPVVSQWIYDLAGAVSVLEELGFVHGDLNPHNIMISPQGKLTLIDFDCAQRIGEEYQSGDPPYHRILGPDEVGLGKPGTSGFAGPRNEQFALGSVFYFMKRGFEPYDELLKNNEEPNVVTLMKNREFPPLDTSAIDLIIHDCWHNKFPRIADLVIRARESLQISPADERITASRDTEALTAICRDFVDKELGSGPKVNGTATNKDDASQRTTEGPSEAQSQSNEPQPPNSTTNVTAPGQAGTSLHTSPSSPGIEPAAPPLHSPQPSLPVSPSSSTPIDDPGLVATLLPPFLTTFGLIVVLSILQ